MKNEKKKQMAIASKQTPNLAEPPRLLDEYQDFLSEVSTLLAAARKQAARAVNTVLVATYWELGRRIIEFEQAGKERAGYGAQLIERLSRDLTEKFGKGFSRQNLQYMRQLYTVYPLRQIRQTVSGDFPASICQTVSGESHLPMNILAEAFPLSWSHSVLLISRSRSDEARQFYHTEALRGGWSVRQLQRQIDSQFYERMALSKDKAALLNKERKKQESGPANAEETIKDPYVLEFLGLKDEYSENDLEEALILCSYKESAVVKYALEGLASKVLAAEYRTVLPDEGRLAKEIEKTRRILDERAQRKAGDGQ